MTAPTDLRSRKRLATRQTISDIATRLFIERGFDQVTVDEIAAAAGVGRMTVFNYFPRKEDLFFDRTEEACAMLRGAVLERPAGVAPVEALRLLAHRLVAESSPAVAFSERSAGFITAIEGSDTLKARARAIGGELAQVVMQALTTSSGREPADGDAHLAAGLLMATWTAAFMQAHRTFRETRDSAKASSMFLAIVDKGCGAVSAAMAGTPYA